MSSPTARAPMRCPRCTSPMHALRLASHRPLPVTVDHCADCRLVWFDDLESVQLDGLGWVRLLREMEHAAARPLADARVPRPACPSCSATLKSVNNRTRFGLFSALECPERHGHLNGHVSLLAERGLVRPMGIAERSALAREQHALHCLNCGARAESSDSACRWCGTALVVVDLPRLAHSLRLRLDASHGPSPVQRHGVVGWPCRGCGAALDPTRQTSCPNCAHLVVAHELPDLLPLLDAAEAELKAAAATRAPAAGPSPGRGERNAEVRTRRERERPVGRRDLLLSWVPVALVAMISLLLLAYAVVERSPGRMSLQSLLAQRVGHDPAGSWAWVRLHGTLARSRDQRALAEGLFALHLRQLAGAEWDRRATIGSLIEGAGNRLPLNDIANHALFERVLNASLEPLPAGAAALPDRLARNLGRAEALGPGLWGEFGHSGREPTALHWLPTVRHRGTLPLPIDRLDVRMVTEGVNGYLWHCQPASDLDPGSAGPAWLQPGETVQFICRNNTAPSLHPGWPVVYSQLREGRLPPLAWDGSHSARSGLQALVDRLVDAAPEALPGPAPGMTFAERWRAFSTGQHAAFVIGLFCAGLALFCAVARLLGERVAVLGGLAAAAALAYSQGRGEGAASVLLVGMYVAVAAIAIFVWRFGWRFYRDALRRALG